MFRDKYGSTGQLQNGQFVAYSSQEHADRLTTIDASSESAPSKEDSRTKAQLMDALRAAGIPFETDANKPALQALAAQHGV